MLCGRCETMPSLTSCTEPTYVPYERRDGGVRPIAVGCSYRRMAAKNLLQKTYGESLSNKLQPPSNLAFGSRGGLRGLPYMPLSTFLNSNPQGWTLRMLFNSVNRDIFVGRNKKKNYLKFYGFFV